MFSGVASEKAALTYWQGLDGSVINSRPGSKITSFFKALCMIMECVSFTPRTLIHKNIPPQGTFHSANPSKTKFLPLGNYNR